MSIQLLSDRNSSVINVKSFGAFGDGASHPLSSRFSTYAQALAFFSFLGNLLITSSNWQNYEFDGLCIQKALYSVPSSGGKVYLPTGKYFTSRSILPKVNTTIVGDGFGSCLAQTPNGWWVKSDGVIDGTDIRNFASLMLNNVNYIHIEGIRFLGSTGTFQTTFYPADNTLRTDQTEFEYFPPALCGINSNYISVTNCYFTDFVFCPFFGLNPGSNWLIQGNIFKNVHADMDFLHVHAQAIQGAFTTSTIDSNTFDNIGFACALTGSNLIVSNNTVRNAYTGGFAVDAGGTIDQVAVVNNSVHANLRLESKIYSAIRPKLYYFGIHFLGGTPGFNANDPTTSMVCEGNMFVFEITTTAYIEVTGIGIDNCSVNVVNNTFHFKPTVIMSGTSDVIAAIIAHSNSELFDNYISYSCNQIVFRGIGSGNFNSTGKLKGFRLFNSSSVAKKLVVRHTNNIVSGLASTGSTTGAVYEYDVSTTSTNTRTIVNIDNDIVIDGLIKLNGLFYQIYNRPIQAFFDTTLGVNGIQPFTNDAKNIFSSIATSELIVESPDTAQFDVKSVNANRTYRMRTLNDGSFDFFDVGTSTGLLKFANRQIGMGTDSGVSGDSRIFIFDSSTLGSALRIQENNVASAITTFSNASGDTSRITYDGSFSCGGAWNQSHLILGTYHLWIDTSGNLRIKNGAPTSATDGVVAGTQT